MKELGNRRFERIAPKDVGNKNDAENEEAKQGGMSPRRMRLLPRAADDAGGSAGSEVLPHALAPGAAWATSRRPASMRSPASSSVKRRSLLVPIPSAPMISSPRKIGTTMAPERPVALAPGRTSPLASVWMLH